MYRLTAKFHLIIFYFVLDSRSVVLENLPKTFTINTEGCVIPHLPLIGENIKRFVSNEVNHDCSKGRINLLNYNYTHLWVNYEALEQYQLIKNLDFFCCYRNFYSVGNIENITYSECIEFKAVIEARHELVRVECYMLGEKMYDDFFIFFPFTYEIKEDNDQLNVIMLGLENMSRLNFHRMMPKTSEFLRKKGSIEVFGYNKVGDNSIPNLFPIVTGRSYKYVSEKCMENNTINMRKCPFIWQVYKKFGYHTVLGSDSVGALLGKYEYNFTEIPTDFYMQPLMFETRKVFNNPYYMYHKCLGTRFIYKILLNYIEDLIISLNNNKMFGIFWEESVTHEELNGGHLMDDGYLDFFKRLDDDLFWNKTILIVFSDHGMRWGGMVRTEQGRLEERLPLLQFLFPDQFKRQYPTAFKNFLINSRRLVTPFDLHATLKHLANISILNDAERMNRIKLKDTVHRSSLFLPITSQRTCKSVGIAEHWCACEYRGKKIPSKLAQLEIATFVLDHVNRILVRFPRCIKLNIGSILEAWSLATPLNTVYNIMIQTYPGNGVLYGTVVKTSNKMQLSGIVSQLNSYRNITCTSDEIARLYCYCGK